MRKGSVLIFIIVILIGISGCVSRHKEPLVKEQVEKYMKDKYNEKFKVLEGTEGLDDSGEEIYVSSEKFPHARIMVKRDDKTGEMIDNYLEFLLKSKIQDVMNKIVSEVYPKSKVFYNTDGLPVEEATSQMSAEEYLKFCTLTLTICVSDPDYIKNKEQKLEQLRLKFEEKQFKPMISVFYLVDGKLDSINENELYERMTESNWSKLRGDFGIGGSYKFRYSDWRELR